ncbi:MAG TPA: dihydroorotate dehydrogenase-like protein [Acidimicrobiales bacterium]|nr:dihydroorotate dehydrogenase-like protein [Acidimicrobiales bacterium]
MNPLSSTWLGLDLRSPVVASSGPFTGRLDTLLRLEDAGVGAVVLPSLFEEQVVHDALALDATLLAPGEVHGEANGYFPELDDYNTGPDRYLTLLETARERLDIPVIASLNANSSGGWIRFAHLLEQAGAHAVELNIYAPMLDGDRDAAGIEDEEVALVADVAGALSIPLAVKLGPWYTSFGHVARRMAGAGARGLVLFNRFYQPDLDLETLDVEPRIDLSEAWELRLPLRWVAALHGRVDAGLAVTSGVHDAAGVAKALLVGADVAMMTSALLRRGPEHVAVVEADLRRWLDEHEYDSVGQLRGSMSQRHTPDPTAYERAQYLRTLASWTSTGAV